MKIMLSKIADAIAAEIVGENNILIEGPCKINEGLTGRISFLSNPKYEEYIYTTDASAVIVHKDFVPQKAVKASLLKVENVYFALATLMEKFSTTHNIAEGIASTAKIADKSKIGDKVFISDYVVIEKDVILGKNVIIYPDVFIGAGSEIADGTVLYSGVKIYNSCIIGKNCIVHSNSVIGADGFGFTPDGNGGIVKIQQLGNVVIKDDVEIGANCTIDRATMGSTIIENNVKIDNMVHIAHNVVVGEQTFIAAQTGVAGSTKIGKHCMIGGQVGILGHIEIADHTSIQAKSGIGGNIKQENTKLYGYPAFDYHSYLKSYAYFKQLPELAAKIKELEKSLKE